MLGIGSLQNQLWSDQHNVGQPIHTYTLPQREPLQWPTLGEQGACMQHATSNNVTLMATGVERPDRSLVGAKHQWGGQYGQQWWYRCKLRYWSVRHNILDVLDGLGIRSDASDGHRDMCQALATAQIQLQMWTNPLVYIEIPQNNPTHLSNLRDGLQMTESSWEVIMAGGMQRHVSIGQGEQNH